MCLDSFVFSFTSECVLLSHVYYFDEFWQRHLLVGVSVRQLAIDWCISLAVSVGCCECSFRKNKRSDTYGWFTEEIPRMAMRSIVITVWLIHCLFMTASVLLFFCVFLLFCSNSGFMCYQYYILFLLMHSNIYRFKHSSAMITSTVVIFNHSRKSQIKFAGNSCRAINLGHQCVCCLYVIVLPISCPMGPGLRPPID